MQGSSMKAASWILETLEKNKIVEHVFFIPGGLIDGFIPYFTASAQAVTPIVAASETGAAYMADGYSRAQLGLGVVMTISGPGLTNIITPIASAFVDRCSILALTGEIGLPAQGLGGIQDGSEEGIDVRAILSPITKFTHSISHINQLPHSLLKALYISLSLQGPVQLSLPTDIQQAEVNFPIPKLQKFNEKHSSNALVIQHFSDLFASEKFKIAILAGKEVINCQASQALTAFAEKYQLPVFTTLEAKGAISDDNALSMGVMGYSGSRHAIEMILSEELDYLIVMGADLNGRDTVNFTSQFASAAKLLYFTEHAELAGRLFRPPDFFIQARVDEVLNFMNTSDALFSRQSCQQREKWLQAYKAKGRFVAAENRTVGAIPIHPAEVVTALRAAMPKETVLVVDSGAHTAFASHYWESYFPNHFLLAGSMGPMGWAIPAGIGAKLARPQYPHVILTGDGCMLMQGMELHTAARYKIPIIVVIINNASYGNVYERFENIPQQAALMEIPERDWVAFAKSLGGNGLKVKDPKALKSAFEMALLNIEGPFVIDVICGKDCSTTVEATMKAAGWTWKYKKG